MKSLVGLVGTVLLATVVATGCQAVGDGPAHPKAIPPIALVTQGSGPAGDYRVWAFRTSDGMSCLEVDSVSGSGARCDPAGDRAGTGGDVARNTEGVLVDASTEVASATTAVLHRAGEPDVSVALVDVGPIMPRTKVAVFNVGPSAYPVAVDFLDADDLNVDSVLFLDVP